MPLTLYLMLGSPPVRAVMLTLKALDMEYDEVIVNLHGGELRKPDKLKINPMHSVPYIDDNGFILYDSHAIITYLMNKYGGEDNPLYPKNPEKRAIIEQRLHFSSGILFPRLRSILIGLYFQKEKTIPEHKITDVKEAYGFAEALLGDHLWIAGDTMTVADFSCVADVTALSEVLVPEVPIPPKVSAWIQRCKSSMRNYKETAEIGNEKFKEIVSGFYNRP